MRTKCGLLFLLCGLAVAINGCGGVGGNTAPTKGKVLVGGTPTAGLNVVFQPAEGWPATGVTDAQGNFTLSTLNPNDGALVGKHKVGVTQDTSASGPPPMPGSPDYDPSKVQKAPFDSKYFSPQTSGIEKEVVSGQNDITIEIPALQ